MPVPPSMTPRHRHGRRRPCVLPLPPAPPGMTREYRARNPPGERSRVRRGGPRPARRQGKHQVPLERPIGAVPIASARRWKATASWSPRRCSESRATRSASRHSANHAGMKPTTRWHVTRGAVTYFAYNHLRPPTRDIHARRTAPPSPSSARGGWAVNPVDRRRDHVRHVAAPPAAAPAPVSRTALRDRPTPSASSLLKRLRPVRPNPLQ